MKIIIEGEPKEIAALEQALKGCNVQHFDNIYSAHIAPAEAAKQTRESVADMFRRYR